MENLIRTANCKLTGGDLFDKYKKDCTINKKPSCGCGCNKEKTSCGCGSHSNNTTMEITGKIIDKNTGEPMLGSAVVNLNSNKGIEADLDGKYLLPANPDDIIEISFIGKKTIKIPANQVTAVIELEDSDEILDEVEIESKKKYWLWASLGLLGVFVIGKTAKKKPVRVNG
ncbi:carboxypeptidase-like regulatory domain-containing protein [Tenacibaculum soleae]|uniref:carboxypeptidase-like regulatory domain-containing protein n=1 Tax=Tenacibaculum soleae TaxID=447689 RepID=UPI00230073B1|nr:carboxypeptidase-like regulatory domain-containing protein [Tenacibaculum soleae]